MSQRDGEAIRAFLLSLLMLLSIVAGGVGSTVAVPQESTGVIDDPGSVHHTSDELADTSADTDRSEQTTNAEMAAATQSDTAEDDGGPFAPRNETHVNETVTLGFLDGHGGSTYEWEIVSGPDTSDDQLLHTSTADIDGDIPHNGRVTSFRPTEPGEYEIKVTVDGEEKPTRTINVSEKTILGGQSHYDLAKKYAPVLNFHPNESFYPTRYEAYVENSDLESGLTTDVEGVTLLDINQSYLGNKNLRLNPRTSGTSQHKTYQKTVVEEQYPETIYTSVHENVQIDADGTDETYTAIGYWMVYVHDPKPEDHRDGTVDYDSVASHTGDQEPVFILFDDAGNPQWVAAQQHKGGELREWDEIETNGNQPMLYIGEGSHPTFFGPFGGETTAEIDDEPEYLYQRQYLCADGSPPVLCGVGSNGSPRFSQSAGTYTDPIIDPTSVTDENQWKPDTDYELTLLTGNESWADYEGDVYKYPWKSDGKVSMQLPRWDSLGDWIDHRTHSEMEQLSVDVDTGLPVLGSVATLTEKDGTDGFTIELTNDGLQPDTFAVVGTATHQGSDTEKTIQQEVYLNTGEVYRNIRCVGVPGCIPADTSFNANQKEVFIPFTGQEGTWEIDLQVLAYDKPIGDDSDELLNVETFELEIDDALPEATVEYTNEPSGVFVPGEEINATVEVENTGDSTETFFVGYSARGPNGTYYDNGGTTGQQVTLDPGETTTVDLSWEVEDDIPGGGYDAVAAVWAESDPANLQTQLDSESANELVVTPQPVVNNISVTDTSGDTVTVEVTATNQGATAEWQTVAVSFPELAGGEIGTVDIDGDFDKYQKVLQPGETAGADYGVNTTELEYPLVEAAADDWATGETKTLTIELPADQYGEIAYAKSVASADGGKVFAFDPGSEQTDHVDQQGEYVYAFTLVEDDVKDEEVGIEISDVDGQAGGANNPQPVTVTVNLSANDDPYLADVTGEMFDIEIGGKSVSTTVLVDDNAPPGEYKLQFVPPKQPAAGEYDLTIQFTDQRFAIELSDEDTIPSAISYSAGDAKQVAASLQLDRSGSMGGAMTELRNGATAFVEQAKDEDYVSIVSYASSANTDYGISQLSTNRQGILNTIADLRSGGRTNIGEAMYDGLDTLDNAPAGTEQAAILMSDGIRNEGPSDSDILNTIVPIYNDRDICLYTIGFTDDADELLEQIADAAECGSYEFASDSGDAESTLQDVFQEIQQEVTGDSLLHQASDTVSDKAKHTFTIDKSIGQTTFSVKLSGTDLSQLNSVAQQPLFSGPTAGVGLWTTQGSSEVVTLYDPKGQEVDPDSNPDVEKSIVGDSIIFRINEPNPGEWSYEIENPEDDPVEYEAEVTGAAQTSLELGTLSDTYSQGGQAVLSASLFGTDGAVSDATIEAEVTNPDGSNTTITFGENPDSSYMGTVELDDAGQYTATVTAEVGNISRTESISWTADSTQPYEITPDIEPEVEPGEQSTIEFSINRSGTAGSDEVVVTVSDLIALESDETIPSDTFGFDNQTVEIDPDGEETVSLELDIPDDAPAGEYEGTFQVFGSLVTKSFTVTVPSTGSGREGKKDTSDADDSTIKVFALSEMELPETIVQGGTLNVSMEVTNKARTQGKQNVSLRLNGSTIAKEQVSLEGGEEKTVTFTVETNDLLGEYDLTAETIYRQEMTTLVVLEPAKFELREIETDPSEVEAGANITVTGTVANVGGVEETVPVTVELNNRTVETRNVTVPIGELKTVEFAIQAPEEPTEHTYSLETGTERVEETLTVLEAAAFELAAVESGTVEAEPSEEVTISATVTNVGAIEETAAVELRLDGETVDTVETRLAGDEGETVEFTVVAPENPGEYTYTIVTGDSEIDGVLSVPQQATPTPTPTPDESPTPTPTPDESPTADETPTPTPEQPTPTTTAAEPADDGGASSDDGSGDGFGVAVALLALLAVVSLARRRD